MFFEYRQNNSGGSFDINDTLTVVVVVEAATPEEADDKAQSLGIYFDGCEQEMDCPCCGDRWYRAYGGRETPFEADDLVEGKYKDFKDWARGKPYARVFYADGQVESYLAHVMAWRDVYSK